LPKPHLRPIAERHSQDAQQVWRAGARSFQWNLLDRSPDPAWLSEAAVAAGVVEDTLAARVSPRGLVAALVARLASSRSVRVAEGLSIEKIGPNDVRLPTGERVSFGHLIVAAGHRSFPLLQQLGSPLNVPLGIPVKGQAALLKADIDPALPVLFLNGLYVVAHEGGHVAVGSTSEDAFDNPVSTDEKLDELIARARVLSPALADAEVVERWAGLRPKAIDRDPMVGPHPEAPRVIALTGGFKVSFGLAHHLAEAALAPLTGATRLVPASFRLDHHLRVALTSV
jgi:glycine oxidase